MLVVIPLCLATSISAAETAHLCNAPANPIVAENCKPGSPPGEWYLGLPDVQSMVGFTTDISVNRGGTIHFKIQTDAARYRLDIYRLGFYGGMGARKIASIQPDVRPSPQPGCLTDSETGLIDCGNWNESARWNVPNDATSGVYFTKLIREDGLPGAGHLVFVVRDDAGHSDLLVQTSDTTWQAYNSYGGRSLYENVPGGTARAYKVSYNRPFSNPWTDGQNWIFNAEYPMIRWLEANGYDVNYFAAVDTDRRGDLLTRHRVFLSVGHDEYWSAAQRAAVEAARDHGVHLAFFSGNEMFWKVRWEPSLDGSATGYRTLVCYKETHANAKIDPDQNWTGTWRDSRFSPPSDGGRPENAITGTLFMVNGPGDYPLSVTTDEGRLRLWRHTDLAMLPPGQTVSLTPGVLGFEWDEDRDNGHRPAGLFHLSTTVRQALSLLQDDGSIYLPGPATHHLTLYRHPSGSLVFGAGTIQWSWGLDGHHTRVPSIPDVRMQQATVNLFADMGVQPGTLQSGLVGATASTDHVAPVSTITIPAAGWRREANGAVIITGTAEDQDGRVAGVEVSIDGGLTWHPAEGRERWRFRWKPCCDGTMAVRSRAVDDSGNLEQASRSLPVKIVEHRNERQDPNGRRPLRSTATECRVRQKYETAHHHVAGAPPIPSGICAPDHESPSSGRPARPTGERYWRRPT
ncbi:MAG TPA: N,N-dimethylformamidase beta subunit family domain-containing protein [Nitrospiraceae bacterium]|nr:N,N-dimethylformamidase beta subunit family domain-containing protein [Nitrospiraceae bacterium]